MNATLAFARLEEASWKISENLMLAHVGGAWRSTELLVCYQRTFNPTHNSTYVQACVHSFHAIHKHSVRPQLPKANASDAINNDARLPLVGFRPRINSENQRSLAAALFFSCEFLGAAWCSSDFFATLKLPFFATGRRPSLRLAVASVPFWLPACACVLYRWPTSASCCGGSCSVRSPELGLPYQSPWVELAQLQVD